jgi:protein SCO1/2
VNNKAILALLLAIMLPLVSYLLVNHYSKQAVVMPPRYFYDSVAIREENGKKFTDTIWHRLQGPLFTNQMGKEVHLSDIKHKVIVVNFFFTSCPTICPGLMRNMKRLQDSFKGSDTLVQFISITVDPEHDSTEKIRAYADRLGINHDNWWILTGNKNEIYDFAFREMKASIADTQVDTAFIHTENFFLLDTTHVIRGWYNGFDENKLSKLAANIPMLMLERDKSAPSIFRSFIPILPIIFIGIGLVFVVILILQRNRKK